MKSVFFRCAAWLLAFSCVLSAALLPASAAVTDERGNEYIVITLDPGHGGTDGGAVATYGGIKYIEKDLCWKIANYCKAYLEEHYWNVKVYLTRGENERPSLQERVDYAVSVDSDFLLSIHLNTEGSGKARGATALVPRGVYRPEQGAVSQNVANMILSELEALGLRNRGFSISTNTTAMYPGGIKADAYFLVRYGVLANLPTIIMEHCFLDNNSDWSNYLSSEAKLKALGQADAKGLAAALGLEDISRKPAAYSSSAQNGATPFTDVYDNQWYYDEVTYVYQHKLMQGMTETTFEPATAASRSMVVTLLYRLSGAEGSADTSTFQDVRTGTWYCQAVEWAYANGITAGVTETEFAPDEMVTREQFVTFLYRYAKMRGCDLENEQSLDAFADGSSVSNFAVEAMEWAVSEGLVKGYSDHTIQPKQNLNRSELAALMHRFAVYLEAGE